VVLHLVLPGLPPSLHVVGTSGNSVFSLRFLGSLKASLQIHALVARGTVILAEHQAGKRDFSQG